MNTYEQKQEGRRARLEKRAAAKRAEAKALHKRSHDLTDAIPFGQPVLMGHHSEKRHRRTLEKSRNATSKAFEASDAARELERRAESVGSGGISSDDPDAPQKLMHQLNAATQAHDDMKRWNAQYRRGGIEAMDATDEVKTNVVRLFELLPGGYGGAPFLLANSSANIRRIKLRLTQLAAMRCRETKERQTANGVRLVENADANRMQIIFPGRPSKEARNILRKAGFRWSPGEGAWQRHLTPNARWAATDALERINAV